MLTGFEVKVKSVIFQNSLNALYCIAIIFLSLTGKDIAKNNVLLEDGYISFKLKNKE